MIKHTWTKRSLYLVLISGGLTGLLLWASAVVSVPTTFAQAPATATPTVQPTPGTPGDSVSFAMLNAGEIMLRGPADANQVDFALPADWELIGDNRVNLNFVTIVPGLGDASQVTTRTVSGLLQISLDNTPIGSAVIARQGENSISLAISNTILMSTPSTNSSNRHVLNLQLTTSEVCGIDVTTVVVHPSSNFLFHHRNVPPTTDLKQLPYPLYQGSFIPDTAVLVIPDQATQGELQAALTVAAGLGRISSARLPITYTVMSKLNNDLVKNNHLIFVGKASSMGQLSQVALPAPITSQGFSGTEIASDDGVLQMTVSPWNNSKVLLVVSGQSDAGVIKASQAVGSGLIRTSSQSNLAVITDAQPKTGAIPTTVDQPLADLGYVAETRWGPGVRHATYQFDIPIGQVVNGDAYFDLVFSHAAILDFDQSSLDITLNGDFVGSMRFSDRTTRVSSWRLNLPRNAFRAGMNTLVLQLNLQPRVPCINQRDAQLWFTARPESTLHLPLGASQPTTRRLDLSDYPLPFLPNLDHTAFVLAPNDPAAWTVAAQLAYDLGTHAEGAIINLAVVDANSVPDQIRQQRDLILVGRPSTLPIIGEMSKAMPASFDSTSDVANESNAELKFRLPIDTPVGYLQIFSPPWSSERAVLAVLGNGEQGLRWASAALINPGLRGKLTGNFAVVNGEQIIATQVSKQPQAVSTVTPTQQTLPAAAPQTNLLWNMMVIGGSAIIVLVLLTLGIVVGRHWQKV